MRHERPDLQQVRRAATRDRIVRAGTHLFEERGYEGTSMRAISEEARVAPRTIYLHFDSKAAILLAYFDDWIDDFVAAVCAGPPDEPVDAAVARAYDVLDADGKVDHRTFDEMDRPHPVLELFSSSNLDIPGHVLQTWVTAQDRLADHFGRATPDDPLAARAKAAAIFATWMVVLLSYRDARERSGGTGQGGPMHLIALQTLRRLTPV